MRLYGNSGTMGEGLLVWLEVGSLTGVDVGLVVAAIMGETTVTAIACEFDSPLTVKVMINVPSVVGLNI